MSVYELNTRDLDAWIIGDDAREAQEAGPSINTGAIPTWFLDCPSCHGEVQFFGDAQIVGGVLTLGASDRVICAGCGAVYVEGDTLRDVLDLSEEEEPISPAALNALANVARALAVQFPPAWTLPPDVQWFALPDRDIGGYCRLHTIETIRSLRGIISDRLEAIEDGSYYERGDWGRWVHQPRFKLDRAENYHRLWWLDVLIAVYT